MKDPVLIRLRRKLEILRLDLKAKGDLKYHDVNEALALLDLLERTHGISNRGQSDPSVGES